MFGIRRRAAASARPSAGFSQGTDVQSLVTRGTVQPRGIEGSSSRNTCRVETSMVETEALAVSPVASSASTTSTSRPGSFRSRLIRTRSSGGLVKAWRTSTRVGGSAIAAACQSWATTRGERLCIGVPGRPFGSQRTSNSIKSTPTSTARWKLATVLPGTRASAPLWPILSGPVSAGEANMG